MTVYKNKCTNLTDKTGEKFSFSKSKIGNHVKYINHNIYFKTKN